MINCETGYVQHLEEDKADTAVFLRFLSNLLKAYSREEIVMIHVYSMFSYAI